MRQFIRAGPQFVEQPRVLDGDDRLGGEVRDQLDLLVGERANFLAIDGDGADDLIPFEHRNRHHGADAAHLDGGHRQYLAIKIGTAFPQVGHMHRLARPHDAQRPVGARTDENSTDLLDILGGQRTVERGVPETSPSHSHMAP